MAGGVIAGGVTVCCAINIAAVIAAAVCCVVGAGAAVPSMTPSLALVRELDRLIPRELRPPELDRFMDRAFQAPLGVAPVKTSRS